MTLTTHLKNTNINTILRTPPKVRRRGGMAQSVEHIVHIDGVVGSSPTVTTRNLAGQRLQGFSFAKTRQCLICRRKTRTFKTRTIMKFCVPLLGCALFELRGTHFFTRGVRKKGTQIIEKLSTPAGNSFTSTVWSNLLVLFMNISDVQ